jgi:uncharacterized RDD family membrane protein YckC
MFGIGKKKEKAEAPAPSAPAESAVALQPAGFWLRFVALVVDSALMIILLGVMMIGAVGVSEDLVAPAYWLWVLISFLYWPVLESTARRGTVGKMMLGLVVADIDGGKLPFLRSLLRNLAKIISAIPFYIGFLLAAFTARKQALHDLITKSVVLRLGASGFARALGVLVVGLLLLIAGGYLAADHMMAAVPKDMQAMLSGETPMPAKPPVMAKATAKPAPAPVAKPAPAPAAPQPVAQSPAPAPVAAAPAPVAKPAPAAPTAAPAPVTKPAPTPAAKPAAAPAPAPKPAPVKVAAAPKPPAMQELKPAPPAPVQSPRPRVDSPQQQSRPGSALPPALVSPRFNDVMTAVLYRDRETVAQLLDFGRWADKRDSNGLTPLMIAAFNGDTAMARLLLERGADPRLQAPGGLTALQFARESGDAATMQLLQPSGAR